MPEINVGINSRQAEAGSARVKNALRGISDSATSAGSILGNMFSPMMTAIAGVASAAGAIKMVQIGDQYTNIASQLEYLTGNTKLAAYAQEDLYKMSQKTGTSMTSNATALSRFALASEMTGLTMEQNIQVLGGINSMMIRTGTSSQEASAAMMQLGQALASGKLSGDEFRSMAENAPGVVNELSRVLGVSRGELRKMSEEGRLTSQVLGQAFLTMSDSAAANADTLPLTVGRMWEKVKNAFERAWDTINDRTGILAWLATALDDLSAWFDNNTDVFVNFFVGLKDSAIQAWPDIKLFFSDSIENMKSVRQSFVDAWPDIQLFFGNLLDLAKSTKPIIDGLTSSIAFLVSKWEELSTLSKYTPLAAIARAAGTIAGGGSIGDAASNFFDADNSNLVEPTSNNKMAGGAAMSQVINFNGQYSRSDVVNISLDLARQGARL